MVDDGIEKGVEREEVRICDRSKGCGCLHKSQTVENEEEKIFGKIYRISVEN